MIAKKSVDKTVGMTKVDAAMNAITEPIIAELRKTIGELGRAGGKVSPSVYDTAQRLRLYPPKEGVAAGLEWLLAQQHADGGWCESTVPAARDIPTLAAILAIHKDRDDARAQAAIQRGLSYLARHADRWSTVHINEVPLGGEMILPYLLNEAERAGFVIDHAPYARLFGMREQKLERLARYPFAANSAPTYSWEALELPFAPQMLDPWTGVGHSPAATAAWLRSAGDAPEYADLRAQAEDYLARAEAATGTGIPGVAPVVYPITSFELSYGLYTLLIAGLLDCPSLQEVVQPKLAELHEAVEYYQGLSFGETFVPDVDGTSTAVAVLRAVGIEVGEDLVRRFWRDDHFYTYIHEINSSVFSNAHALHALITCKSRCSLTEAYLVERQEAEGQWAADKWHTSWRFTTLEAINALESLSYTSQLGRAACALLSHQLVDGSWHDGPSTGILETSYTVLALRKLRRRQLLDAEGQASLCSAYRWLQGTINQDVLYESRWLGKVLYSPYRVDRVYHLSAILCEPLTTLAQPVSANTSLAAQAQWTP
jgi:hypothetical protein